MSLEMVVNLSVEGIDIELFNIKGKRKTLIEKEVINKKMALDDFSKLDAMEIESELRDFSHRYGVKKGKIHFIVDGGKSVTRFNRIFVDVAKKRDVQKVLPMQIEDIGDEYAHFDYRYTLKGKNAELYFMKKSIIDQLSDLKLPRGWEYGRLLSGLQVTSYAMDTDGVVLKLGESSSTIYTFKKGFEVDRQEFKDRFSSGEDPNVHIDMGKESIADYVANVTLSHNVDVEKVYVMICGDFKRDLEDFEYDGIRFISVVDRSDTIDVEVPVDPKVSMFYPMGTTIAFYNMGSDYDIYDFSPNRMGNVYKNVLTFSVSTTLLLGSLMPVGAMYIDSVIEDERNTVSEYVQLIDGYETDVEMLQDMIDENDEQIEDYNSYVRSLENLQHGNQYFVSGVMEFLPDNTPSEIVVQSLETVKNNREVRVAGMSENYRSVGAFAIQLEDMGDVSIEQITDNDLDNEYGYGFVIVVESS